LCFNFEFKFLHAPLHINKHSSHSFFFVQISDFGLAVTGGNQNKGNIKLSGTLGYVAPEYLLDGRS